MHTVLTVRRIEVFTLPHLFCAESVQSPRTKFGLFLAEPPANFENPSPNLVLGQSEDSPRTARTLGLSSDGVHGLISDSPRTVLGLSEYLLFYYYILI